jgi:hypothetical protein
MAQFLKVNLENDFALHKALSFEDSNTAWDIVGYRLLDVRNRKFYDVGVDVVNQMGHANMREVYLGETLPLVPTADGSKLATQAEIHLGKFVSELPVKDEGIQYLLDALQAHKYKAVASKSVELKLPDSESRRITEKVLSLLCAHKHMNLRWEKQSSEGFRHGIAGWMAYKSSDRRSVSHFNWNQDHDYCERQYDCYSIIEDGECPKFEEVKAYAQQLKDRYTLELGVIINVEVTGVKDTISVSVSV